MHAHGVHHEVELFVRLDELVHEAPGVLGVDVVVVCPVHQEEPAGEVFGVLVEPDFLISGGVLGGPFHDGFGPFGVVDAHIRDGGDGDAGFELGGAGHAEQGVRAAVAPAPDSDAAGIDPFLRLEPAGGVDEVVQLDLAHIFLHGGGFELLADGGRGAVIDHDDGISLVEENLIPARIVPLVLHAGGGRAAVAVDDDGVLLPSPFLEIPGAADEGGHGKPVAGGDGGELGEVDMDPFFEFFVGVLDRDPASLRIGEDEGGRSF